MRQARPLRDLQPMTMADILRPQLNSDSEEQRKSLRKSRGRRRRFVAFLILSFVYASSGISIAAVVVPAVIKQISHAVSGAKTSDGTTDDTSFVADESDVTEVSTAGRTAAATSSASSISSSSSGNSDDGGGAGAVPEPSSVILLSIGCAALGAEALRRRLARRK
jgi:hypothetical protein